MRLLVVSQYFWPEDFRVNDLVKGMRERGHEVTVLANLPNYNEGRIYDDFLSDPSAFSHYNGAEIVRVPVVPRGSSRLGLALNYLSFVLMASTLGVWRLHGRQFDSIFVFQNSPLTAVLPAVLLRRLKRAPLAIWVLDLWPETLQAIGVIRSRASLKLVGIMTRFIYRHCDLILIQSKAFESNIVRYGGARDRVRYFPNWAEPVFSWNAERAEPGPEVTAFESTFNVMFAGNVGEAQDFPAIMDAAEACRDVTDLRWLIVGEGRMADYVRQEAVQRGLQDRVILLGRHAVERMPSFFAGADALLVTLRDEPIWSLTIPGKLQSYLAAGLPVLAMLDGEGRRVVEESGGGFAAAAGDAGGLAAAVRRLHGMSEAERRKLGQQGKAYGRSHFDREVLFGQFESWLLGLAKHH